MEQIMEFLKADKEERKADKEESKADKAESMAKMERLLADNKEMKAQIGGLASRMDADKEEVMATIRKGQEELIQAITGASWESIEARDEKVKALPEKTEACLVERKKPAPEEAESVEEPQVVPIGATDEETVQGTEDQTGELRPAVRCRRQRKKRAQIDGEPRQKFAAFRGWFTRRAVPAMRKGHVRRGPGKRCSRSGIGRRSKASRAGKRGMARNNVEQGAPEGRTDEKKRRTLPECRSNTRLPSLYT
jgi:hypothetical protein